jgi:Flp pilus assembly protein protease CpaA
MTLGLLIIFGAVISRIDIRTHKIPNRALVYFLICAAALSFRDLSRFAQISLLTLLFGILFSLVIGLGMGDVKLIAVLIPLLAHNHALKISLLLICISVTSIVAAVITIVKKGTISVAIPWAPSLFSGAILYLATR